MVNKYMENRKNISIMTKTYDELVEIRKYLGLKSLTDTVAALLEITKSAKIDKRYECETCGKILDISPDTDPKKIGLTHNHVANTDCLGCIKTQYVLHSESNDKNSEQTEQIEIHKSQREIDDEKFESDRKRLELERKKLELARKSIYAEDAQEMHSNTS
jgi:hypothetical protein